MHSSLRVETGTTRYRFLWGDLQPLAPFRQVLLLKLHHSGPMEALLVVLALPQGLRDPVGHVDRHLDALDDVGE
jgi:hypothetical protein